MIFNSIFLLYDKALYEEPISAKKTKTQFLSRFTLTESLSVCINVFVFYKPFYGLFFVEFVI